ncbi:LbetaH domain-containing protein [Paenibacillus kobensis]|uniref:serine acetyltransferase n=1 Tax=Paenibacillus kobensis TaxID=59841 RepID=UPI000FD754AC|nr:serine acetyltransferase [Paenibacillus kobensis]
MELSLSVQEFREYVSRQLNHFFPDKYMVQLNDNSAAFDLALERTEYCLKDVTLQTYFKDGNLYLNHLYSDQYAVFLWFLSNSIWSRTEDLAIANKLFYLNKSLHGFSCLYDTKLPSIFLLLHTVGTVLGKAEYGDYLVAGQGSTVGAQNGKYPILGRGVAVLPHSSIIGDCVIGDKVSVGINASVYQKNIENNTVVYRSEDGSIGYKYKEQCWAQRWYNVQI